MQAILSNYVRFAMVTVCTILFASIGTARADTFVSGQAQTGTWTQANSPYRVTGTITVPTGHVLTIEPGVDVLFDANVQFIVQGAISANGTLSDSIRFLPNVDAGITQWAGMRINGGQTNQFRYVRMSGANAIGSAPDDRGGAIYAVDEGTVLDIENCVFSGNRAATSGGALYVTNGAALTMVNSRVTSNTAANGTGGGVAVLTGQANLSNTTIDRNTASGQGGGVYVSASHLAIESSVFEWNSATGAGGGLLLSSSTATIVSAVFDTNASGNDGGAICLYNASSVDLSSSLITRNKASDEGAGLFANAQSTVTIDDTPFRENRSAAYYGGGGIYVDNSTLTVTNSPIEGNFATGSYGSGAGIRASASTVRVSDSPLTGNRATGSNGNGGGLYAYNCDLILLRSSVINNFAYDEGGGIALWNYGTAIIKDSPIRGNEAATLNGGGVRIYNRPQVTIDNSPIIGNTATLLNGGGIAVTTYSDVRLIDSPVDSNFAGQHGGGVAVWDNGILRLTNCAVGNNESAQDGGGVYGETAALSMLNCSVTRNTGVHGGAFRLVKTGTGANLVKLVNITVTENVATGTGGGIRAFQASATIMNSIFWNNLPVEFYTDESAISATFSDIAYEFEVWPGDGNINADPLFADPLNAVWLPGPGSPAIDSGNPQDLRDKDGTRIDMGALPYRIAEVRGTITETVWTHANSPYRVIGTVTVPAGQILTIEPGTDVFFDVDAQFIVNGAVHANGTQSDSVRFLPWLADYWGGIRVMSADSSSFAFTRIGQGYARGSSGNNQGGALFIQPGGRVGVVDAVISENRADSYGGAVLVGQNAIFTAVNSVFRHNWGYRGGAVSAENAKMLEFHSSSFIADSVFGYYGYGGAVCAINVKNVTFIDCVLDTNISTNSGGAGGAVYISGPSSVRIEGTRFTRNVSNGDYGGAVFASAGTVLEVKRSEFTDNRAYSAGAIHLTGYGTVGRFDFTTVSGNYSQVNGGGFRLNDYAELTIRNSIVWGNYYGVTPQEIYNHLSYPVNVSIEWTLINASEQWLGLGPGNINADPMFADTTNGDYTHLVTSPAIDAANPNAQYDPDGTRADMGVWYFNQSAHRLELPTQIHQIDAIMEGDTVRVPVRAWFENARGVELELVVDRETLLPADSASFVENSAFADLDDFHGAWTQSGDTIRVALSASDALSLSGEELLRLVFVASVDLYPGLQLPLAWLPYPATNVNERAVVTADGLIAIELFPHEIHYGDVTDDGQITSYDASLILQYVVASLDTISTEVADVSGNGFVSAYDASLVLYKVVHPAYVFPVLGGPLLKPATTTERILTWILRNGAWELTIDDASGLAGGILTIRVSSADSGTPSIEGAGLVASRYDGDEIIIAFARVPSDETTILRIAGTDLDDAPNLTTYELNDGNIAIRDVIRPIAFSLRQNAPNPFNPSTTIQFGLPETNAVSLVVYDVNGRTVRTLVSGERVAGVHEVTWDGMDDTGRAVASGVYVYRLVTGTNAAVRKMVLVR